MSRSEATEQLFAAILGSWSLDPWLLAWLVLTSAIYLRGFARLRRQTPERFPGWRAVCFLSAQATVYVALASPLDALASLLLQVHMSQHLLLTMVAPPLFWLGAPWIPLLRGLPPRLLKEGLGPFLASPEIARLVRAVTHPIVAWTSFVLATWIWHAPALYERALVSPLLHAIEHVFFFATGLLFWWPVVQPWPSRPVWPRWTMIPYLLLADLQNTVFSALFAMLERPIYATYAAAPRLFSLSALDDQATAGAIMWVPGSIAFLLPVGLILVELLEPRLVRPHTPGPRSVRALALTQIRARRFDLLTVPYLGAMLRSSGFRRAAQGVLLLLAAAIVLDGLFGSKVAAMNLAGTLPWTYWRGFVVLALLVGGNFFCTLCPFMLPRELARRLPLAHRRWPRALRSKWLAVGLLALFLWAYEALALWESPWWTAWVVLAYFVAAFAVDALFRGASFCKYVCPIGQFNFVQSMASPLDVQVKDAGVCRSCSSQDCLRGNEAQRGCELELYLPTKRGNLDCTFCLDCVRACPHDNVGLIAVVPGLEVLDDRPRSSLRRLSRRPDLAALVLLLTFGAFANAAGMVEPVAIWQDAFASYMGGWRGAATTLLLLLALVVVPAAVAVACAFAARSLARLRTPWREILCRFSLALVPLGFAMWIAHFTLHLVHGAGTAVPAAARALRDLGFELAPAAGAMSHAFMSGGGVVPLEILLLDAGLLLALYLAWRVAGSYAAGARRLALVAPWTVLATILYLVGVWIAFQPMQMRGMMMMQA